MRVDANRLEGAIEELANGQRTERDNSGLCNGPCGAALSLGALPCGIGLRCCTPLLLGLCGLLGCAPRLLPLLRLCRLLRCTPRLLSLLRLCRLCGLLRCAPRLLSLRSLRNLRC